MRSSPGCEHEEGPRGARVTDRSEAGLWADLERESHTPGPTMTITKGQYAALLALRSEREGWATSYGFLTPEGLAALVDARVRTLRPREREEGLREALGDAVTLYRDAEANTRQVPDGLNGIIAAAMALVDAWLPSADDVRGVLSPLDEEAAR